MFFPKLRAHAKWVFVLLAIVFAGGFVFLGVGSGSGIGDLLGGNIGNLFSGGSSVSAEARSTALRYTSASTASAWLRSTPRSTRPSNS